jgi:thioredoxin-related protein
VSNNYEFNLLSQGYLEDKKIEPLLIYTVENAFKTTPYETFSKQFNHTFYDTTFVKAYPKTYSLKEIEKLQKKKPKKILVNITSNFCNSCKVQSATTLKDTSIVNYINKNFYLIDFNAESNDTIVYKGEKLFKTPINGYPLHTFAIKITNSRLQFPSIAILDDKQNHLDVVGPFLSPSALLPILKFYAEDKYQTTTWPDFIKAYNEQKK